jgi:O-antigen/teichoic acid export membrane protein
MGITTHIKKLLVGNGLAQALQLVSLLVLSRIYYPSDFGVLAQVQSISTAAVVIATLQLHLTIPLCKNNDEARIASESVQSITFILFLSFLPIAIYLGKVFVFSIFLAFALGLTNNYNSYLVFNGEFGRMSRFYVLRAILIIALQISFAHFSVPDGLLWGTVLAECISAICLRILTLGSLFRIKVDIHKGLEMAFKLKSFSLYGTIQELISVSAFYAPLFLFANKYGESIGGQYAMASRLVWGPVVLISSSLSQVLYHKFGKQTPNEIWSLRYIFFNKTVLFCTIGVCSLSFLSENVFLFMLGSKWGLACKILTLQIIWGGIFLLSVPFRVALRVMLLQKYQLIIDACTLVITAMLFGFINVTPMVMMWVLVMTVLVQNAFLSTIVWSTLKSVSVRMINESREITKTGWASLL